MLRQQNVLVAITGGSGSGKTFQAERLRTAFSPLATRLSLDDFYLDRSNLPPSRRARINFDHPRALDWDLAEKVARDCRHAHPIRLPKYDFKTHVRLTEPVQWTPTPLVLWDGLWLLSRPSLRALFDLKIYLECPTQLRLDRRLSRDVSERARNVVSIRDQFWRTVFPMHVRYVAPQSSWADIILQQPSSESEFAEIVAIIRGLLSNVAPTPDPEQESTSAVPATAGSRPSCRSGTRFSRKLESSFKTLKSL